jgi:hypothetical protein
MLKHNELFEKSVNRKETLVLNLSGQRSPDEREAYL